MPFIDIGLDGEWSGPDPHKNFMVSLGIVAKVADKVADKGNVVGSTKILFRKPKNREWDEDTRNNFWLSSRATLEMKEEVARIDQRYTGYDPEDGIQKAINFIDYIKTIYADNNGDNITFKVDSSSDIVWVSYYLGLVGHLPLYIFFGRYKDTWNLSSYSLGITGMSSWEYSSNKGGSTSEDKAVRHHLQIPQDIQPTVEHNHDPLSDVMNMLEEHEIQIKYANKRKRGLFEYLMSRTTTTDNNNSNKKTQIETVEEKQIEPPEVIFHSSQEEENGSIGIANNTSLGSAIVFNNAAVQKKYAIETDQKEYAIEPFKTT